MDKKIKNSATVILLEILGVLGIDNVVKVMEEGQSDDAEEQGYFIINYLFRNIRRVQPQLDELITLLTGEDDLSILEGIVKLKDDKEVLSFFTQSLGEVMKSI